MTTHTLPVALQASQEKLRSAHKPVEPYHHNTVKSSETAFEGESIFEFILFAIAPWWAEGLFEGGSDDSGEKDYLIGTPLAFVVSLAWLGFGTDLPGWEVFAFSMLITAATFLGLILFHLVFHKCISMFIYNRLFRRGWMKKTRETDKAKYLDDVATYPQRLREYEEARNLAVLEAETALTAYHTTSPTQKYKIGVYGFEPVTGFDQVKGFAAAKARSVFGRLTQR